MKLWARQRVSKHATTAKPRAKLHVTLCHFKRHRLLVSRHTIVRRKQYTINRKISRAKAKEKVTSEICIIIFVTFIIYVLFPKYDSKRNRGSYLDLRIASRKPVALLPSLSGMATCGACLLPKLFHNFLQPQLSFCLV